MDRAGRKDRRGQQEAARFEIEHQQGRIDNIGRDLNIYADAEARQLEDLKQSGVGIKLMVILAVLLCLAGIATLAIGMFTTNNDLGSPDFGKMPSTVPLGAALFFGGFVLAAISSLIVGLRRRR
jgi:hypothetical protein